LPNAAAIGQMDDRLKSRLIGRALEAGFSACGVADASKPWEAGDRLAAFLAAGRQGTMGWLARTLDRRRHPQALWPQAKTAVMLAASYAPPVDPLALVENRTAGLLSVYAARRDYHDVLKGRAKQLAHWLAKETEADVKVFVDTAPLMEKPLAQSAGIGWQGKHTNLVSRQDGSWTFLACILSAAVLSPDPVEADRCGSCRACLDICPTGAFPAPYQLDATRCIAYLTVEHEGSIDAELRPLIGNRVFGCDDCLAVCPWNKFAQTSNDHRLALREDLLSAPLRELAGLDEASFRVRFAGTPVKRTGRTRFMRNVMIAIGNSGDPALMDCVLAALEEKAPLVRGAAVWAARRLLSEERFSSLKKARAGLETDPCVLGEWGIAS
jgi:epoxyqueuosine reductase